MLNAALLLAASIVVGQAESAQATFLPKEVVASYQYLMGTWKTQGRIGEERSEGEVSFRWAPGRFSYVLTGFLSSSKPGEPDQQWTGLGGYDPVKKQTIEKIFWSDGSHYTLYFDTSTPVRNKGSITGELTGMEHGQEFQAKISVERKGPEEFVYGSQTADGRTFEVTFSKISGPKAAKAKPKQD